MTADTTRLNRYVTDYTDTAITFVAIIGVLFVAAAGLILSYESLLDLATVSGAVNSGLAWLWPLTLDALAIVASLNVLWSETRQERDRYAWTLVIVFTFLSVVFNATHAGMDSLLAWSPYASVTIAATELSALSGKLSALNADTATLAEKRDAIKAEIDNLRAEKRTIVTNKRPCVPGDMDTLDDANATRQAIIADRRATVQKLLQDKSLTIADIAGRLEVSERTIQRDVDLRTEQNGHPLGVV